jgi:hypothetical protein
VCDLVNKDRCLPVQESALLGLRDYYYYQMKSDVNLETISSFLVTSFLLPLRVGTWQLAADAFGNMDVT